MSWTDLQAEIADLFEGQAKRDRWDRSSGALDYIATHLPTGISRRERAELCELEQLAERARRLESHFRRRAQREAELKALRATAPRIANLARPFVCFCCGESFGTRQSMTVHQAVRRSRRAA
jgi:hypothetical protein